MQQQIKILQGQLAIATIRPPSPTTVMAMDHNGTYHFVGPYTSSAPPRTVVAESPPPYRPKTPPPSTMRSPPQRAPSQSPPPSPPAPEALSTTLE